MISIPRSLSSATPEEKTIDSLDTLKHNHLPARRRQAVCLMISKYCSLWSGQLEQMICYNIASRSNQDPNQVRIGHTVLDQPRGQRIKKSLTPCCNKASLSRPRENEVLLSCLFQNSIDPGSSAFIIAGSTQSLFGIHSPFQGWMIACTS